MAFMNPPRRVKSGIDIQHLILNEHSPTSFSSCNSMLPMVSSYKDRKPSITIERPTQSAGRRRPSVATDRPLLSQTHFPRNRRPSCCAERPAFSRHKNFISFDQPTISLDRRTSVAIEKPPSIVHQPTVSFEPPCESLEKPFLVIEPPSTNQDFPPLSIMELESSPKPFRKTSLSFEETSKYLERQKSPRMATSLDIHTIDFERRSSIPETDRASPVSITFDETKITAPLLESLKSSDV